MLLRKAQKQEEQNPKFKTSVKSRLGFLWLEIRASAMLVVATSSLLMLMIASFPLHTKLFSTICETHHLTLCCSG